jgi:hypothetical protein
MTHPVFAIHANSNSSDFTYRIVGPADAQHWFLAQKVLRWATCGDQYLFQFGADPSKLREWLINDGINPDDIAPDIVDINQLR